MPNPDSKLNIKFNIQLDLETDEQLIGLAEFLHIKKSQCIRHLIRAGFQMHVQQIPTCASCEACRAPHTFTYVNQPAPASPPQRQAKIAELGKKIGLSKQRASIDPPGGATDEEKEHESICDFCSRVVDADEIWNCQKCGKDCMCDQCFMEHQKECKDG